MATNNNIPTELKVPESITDPDEREYFELLYGAIRIAAKKGLPFMILTAYDNIENCFLTAAGCKHCITNLIKEMLDKQPDILNVIMGGISMHLMEKQSQDIQIINNAKKNTPAGN